jgi:hypothetical protein
MMQQQGQQPQLVRYSSLGWFVGLPPNWHGTQQAWLSGTNHSFTTWFYSNGKWMMTGSLMEWCTKGGRKHNFSAIDHRVDLSNYHQANWHGTQQARLPGTNHTGRDWGSDNLLTKSSMEAFSSSRFNLLFLLCLLASNATWNSPLLKYWKKRFLSHSCWGKQDWLYLPGP